MHPLVCSGFVLLLGVLDASGQSWLVDTDGERMLYREVLKGGF